MADPGLPDESDLVLDPRRRLLPFLASVNERRRSIPKL